MRATQIVLDLPALSHNLEQVRQRATHAKVMAMVKADAYGHGAVACLPALQNADALGVACLDEAITLQSAGWHKPIVLIEGAFNEAEWQYAATHDIQCVVHNAAQLEWALNWALNPAAEHQLSNTTIWLKLNTGMNRLGFNPADCVKAAQQLHEAGYQLILTSHFANADKAEHPMNMAQGQLFDTTLNQLKADVSFTIQGSLCNSAGIVNWQAYHHDWVRAGIMLYGSSPVSHATADELNLRPVMNFSAKIFAIHSLNVGDMVGYGSRWTATQPTRIGIVSVGYGDGYPRVVSDAAYVMSADQVKLPIIGRVAMDMLMVDLTEADAQAMDNCNANSVQKIDLDTPVMLWGTSPDIDTLASWTDTISYELLCKVTQRPLRLTVTAL